MQSNKDAQPAALKIFFATEMWERYGFYTIQTLLALYLVLSFKWVDSSVYSLVGSFTALNYVSPVIGGWIADSYLGQKRSIITGAILLLISYILLGQVVNEYQLIMCLAGIIVGTGLLKPNISSLLGNIYPVESPNRERGFTIFYMGITSGILLGTTIPSLLKNTLGWHSAFLSAGIGLIIAIAVFILGSIKYKIKDYSPYEHSIKDIILAGLIICIMGVGAFYVLYNPKIGNSLFIIVSVLSLIYLLSSVFKEEDNEGKKTIVILVLSIISVMYWAFYFQMFLSLTLLLKRLASPSLFGIAFPPPYYVAVQSIGMIVFGVFLGFGKNKEKNYIEQSISAGDKFVYAMIFLTVSFGLFTVVCYSSTTNILFSPLYFIPAYLFFAVAELLLSPVGLATVTLLSDNRNVSTMTGIFFVTLGLGGFLSGKLAALTSVTEHWTNTPSTGELKLHYAVTINELLNILILATLTCIALNFVIKYVMKNLTD